MANRPNSMVNDLLDQLKSKNVTMKTRKKTTTRPKVKSSVIVSNQPKIFNFIRDKGLNSTITSDCDQISTLSQVIHGDLVGSKTYIMVFGTSSDMLFIEIFILLVDENQLPKKHKPEDPSYIRYRLNGSCFVGKIMLKSRNLQALQMHTKSAMGRVFKFPGYKILKSTVSIACTKQTEIMIVDETDARFRFLKVQLGDVISSTQETEVYQLLSSTQKMNQDNMRFHEADEVSNVTDIMEHGDWKNNETEKPAAEFLELSSACSSSEGEATTDNKKKRRVHRFSKQQVIAKLRDQRKQLAKETDASIVRLVDKLQEILPTLSSSDHASIFMKSLFTLCTEINTKLNCIRDSKMQEANIPLTHNISLTKIPGKKEIKLGGKIVIPALGYAKAIKAEKPWLVVSRIIRYCFDKDMKLGCEVNEKPDESNFIYRLGDANLSGVDRLNDGHEVLDMIIEHAHMVKEESAMTLSSYRESLQQVNRALYDFKRRESDRLEKALKENSEKNSNINHQVDQVDQVDDFMQDYVVTPNFQWYTNDMDASSESNVVVI